MKTKNIIQRLCLFLFVLVLAAPAWATNYGREGYEVFRSGETVKKVGKKSTVGTLKQGKVEITFSSCKTTNGTGSDAIYELAKGSRITVKADDGYAIRWIILRDTEGGESYRHPQGKYRISSVTSGYQYYFEKEAVSNSGVKGHNENNLNDDDNNIVVYQYDASAQSVEIRAHNNSKWDQFKVRDIIVGYVRAPKVRFKKDRYDMYYMPIFHPQANYDDHSGSVGYKLNNNDIATVNANGLLKFKRPGTVVLTATCSASENCAKAQCKTTVTMKRDRVTFTSEGLPDVIFNNTSYSIRDYLNNSKTKSGEKFDYNDESFSVTSSNNAVLRYDDRWLKFGGTAGEATITFTQKETNFYEAASLSHTIIVARRDQYGTILIKDANEWKVFCKLVNEKGMTNLNARLEADVNLGGDIMMLGEGNSYRGTFDGQGHTLKFNWNVGSKSWMAPIKSVTDATIKNLHTEGQITSSTYALSGLVCSVYGTTAISGCVSNVNLTSSYSGSTCDAAGMAVNIHKDARITFDDCVVMGTFNGTESGRAGMSGFVGTFQKGTCILNNCLYLGESNAKSNSSSYTFAPGNATIKNCYYLNACGATQGEQVTKDQLKNGEVAYKLQARRNNMVWGQELNKDTEPLLTADGAKRVRKVEFTYNSQVKATRYATHGKAIYGSMPTFTPKDLLGSDYNEHHYYSGIAFEDGFSASTNVTADKRVTVSFTKKDYYEIASKENWKEFCDIVNGGQNAVDAKLTRNIDLGSEINMVGNDNNKYSGTFDGQNHTLKLNWDSGSNGYIAPFGVVEGATIRNLRTEGQITSNEKFLSGLLMSAYGTTTLTNCVSNVNITSSILISACNAAGLICSVKPGANVTIDDCVVKGNITATTDKGKNGMAGFVIDLGGTCTLNNCLYLGSGNGDTFSRTFVGDAYYGVTTTLNNCYYLNTCGTAQGTKITAEQLKNGYVAYKLQNGRNTQFWGQNLDTDNEPQLTADAAKHVYEVKFTYNNKVAATRYANSGKAIAGGMPTLTAKDLLGTGYNPHHYYTIAFAGGFNGSTTVNADRTVAINLTEKDYYEIASKDNWIEFSNIVYGGQNAVDAKMTADVDLGGDFKTIGGVHKYSGTFDGQGHTLTVNWAADNAGLKAPFGYVDGATIKNLRTKGKIQGNYGLAGLIYSVYGNTTVSDCVSEVDIKGAHGLAGMIYRVNSNAKVTMTDCVVKGDLTATTEDGKKQMVGFIYGIYGGNTLTNCLYIGTNNATAGNTFAFGANATNCYYLNACGRVQGTKVTEEQLKNGYVAHKLQAGRTDNSYWAQVLGEEPSPYRETGKSKTNYVYYDTANSRWACEDFRLTDGQSLPIGIDFTAANVTYERDLSIGKATLCLPYDLYAQGFKAYTLSGGNKNEVHFKEVDDKLTAYTPYYITANGMPQLGGRNIEVKAYKADKMTTPAAGYKFTGTVAGVSNATAAAANAYILQDDGLFHKVTTEHPGATVPAYRAYVTCPKGAGAKQLSIVIDGETTGIGGATNDARGRADGPVYDLQGRRVADRLDDARHRLPAGVYIVGGRKVVVK